MAKLLDIVIHPNKTLREKSKKLDLKEIKDKKFQSFVLDMKETMIKKDGIGLAAPQVGKNIRLIIVSDQEKIIPMINPEITKKSWAKEWGEEGCLSIPNTFGKVKRHKKIKCVYIDKNSKK